MLPVVLRVIAPIARIGANAAGKMVIRIGNRAGKHVTRKSFNSARDRGLRATGTSYEKLNGLAKKCVDESHEVIVRAVTDYTIDIVEFDWENASEDERTNFIRRGLFDSCARAVYSRINSNLFDVGFDFGANGEELRKKYQSMSDPHLVFMDDYEWFKVFTMSTMEACLEEMDES